MTTIAVILAQRDYHPSFDNALIWMRADDVGGPHTPLVGPWSRFGWEHPGPALYFLLAVPLRLMSMSPSGLLVGAFLIAAGSAITAIVLTSRRAGGQAGCVLAVALGVLAIGLAERVISPWNPYILVLPFALFVIAAWLWSAGDDWLLLIAVASGTFAAQSHVGAVVALAMVGATACVLRALALKAFPPDVRALASAVVLAIMLWALPLWQQLTSDQGNLRRVVQFFLEPDSEGAHRIGWSRGLQLAAGELSPWGPWTGNQVLGLLQTIEPQALSWLVLPIVLLGFSLFTARRWHDTLTLRLALLTCAAVIACVVGYAHIRGLPHPYMAVWPRVVAMLTVVVPIVGIVRRQAYPSRRMRSSIESFSVLLAASAFCFAGVTATLPDTLSNEVLARFGDAARNAVPRGTRVRVVAAGVPFSVSAEGLAVLLIGAGRSAYLQPMQTRLPGEHRCVAPTDVLPTLALLSGPAIDELRQRSGARVLAEYDPISPDDRRTADALGHQLSERFRELGRDDLVSAIALGDEWLAFHTPREVDAAVLKRWTELAAGDRNRRYALLAFPPTAW